MKKQVSKFIQSIGGSTRYSGHTKTMYITYPYQGYDLGTENNIDVCQAVNHMFEDSLTFKLMENS